MGHLTRRRSPLPRSPLALRITGYYLPLAQQQPTTNPPQELLPATNRLIEQVSRFISSPSRSKINSTGQTPAPLDSEEWIRASYASPAWRCWQWAIVAVRKTTVQRCLPPKD